MLPQDNEPLREALDTLEQEAVEWYKECQADIKESGYPNGDAKELSRARKHVLALFQAEQTRLKAELIAKLREMLPDSYPEVGVTQNQIDYASGFNQALTEVSAALDTLERGA